MKIPKLFPPLDIFSLWGGVEGGGELGLFVFIDELIKLTVIRM